MNLTGISNTIYMLEHTPIASGGEGDVYKITNPTGLVAKIYKPEALSSELADKLGFMVSNPPSQSVLTQVAWPRDVVSNDAGEFCGFIMPELQINASLSDVYKYPAAPGFPITMRNKIMIAQNICVVINEVHGSGYVFGDFNPLNSGLDTGTGRISFLDTDTYHVNDGSSGITYRCNVCAPGYCAPELLEKVSDYITKNPLASQNAYASTPLPTFTKETDNFALAIHVFKLLMNGYSPFGGIIDTASASQASPGVGDTAVRRDSYCFKPGYKHQSAAIPALDSLPSEIADLFTLAFIIGKVDPDKRPSAEMWYAALERYEQVLVDCTKNGMHQYDKKNADCPLCAADKAYMQAIGQTPTPIQVEVQAPVQQYAPAPVTPAQTNLPASQPPMASIPSGLPTMQTLEANMPPSILQAQPPSFAPTVPSHVHMPMYQHPVSEGMVQFALSPIWLWIKGYISVDNQMIKTSKVEVVMGVIPTRRHDVVFRLEDIQASSVSRKYGIARFISGGLFTLFGLMAFYEGIVFAEMLIFLFSLVVLFFGIVFIYGGVQTVITIQGNGINYNVSVPYFERSKINYVNQVINNALYQAAIQSKPQDIRKFCKKCGMAMSGDITFCTKCGTKC